MIHYFDIDDAEKYGIHAAIILQNFRHWIARNKANNTNFYDGRYWTFNSKRAMAELFPYMTERQIEYALKKLVDEKVLITGNYNKMAMDRTMWYAFNNDEESIPQNCEMHSTNLLNAFHTGVEPIPYINTNSKPQILNPDNKESKESLFETFWKAYPKKQSKDSAFKAYSKIKNINEEAPNILQGLERAKANDYRFKEVRFTPMASTWLNAGGWKDEFNQAQEIKLQTQDKGDYRATHYDPADDWLADLKEEYKGII